MISGRMLSIINYLDDKTMSSIKEISNELGIDTRKVRYDVDNINDLLKLSGKKQITKLSKGFLEVPEDFSITTFCDDEFYIFSLNERVEILKFIALFKVEDLNLETLSKKFQVSRSTIKNDLSILEKELEEDEIFLTYNKGFKLQGDENRILSKRVGNLRRYVYITERKNDDLTTFEKSIVKLLEESFLHRDIFEINIWTNNLLHQMGWILNDDSYYWYLSNILVLCWYIINEETHPLEKEHINRHIFDIKLIKYLEEVTKCTFNSKQIDILVNFVLFTNKYASLNDEMDLIATQSTVNLLIKSMSRNLNYNFKEDMILYKGLLNHIAPLIERIKNKVQIYDERIEIIPKKYNYVSKAMEESIKDIVILNEITNKNEIDLLTIHFLGGIQRSKSDIYMNILLVCGFGYGAIAMIKDKLINNYQVNVVKSIPSYKLERFDKWDDIDLVVSTSKITKKLPKPVVVVNSVFQDEDYSKLESIGVYRKNTLINYFSINKRLDFLDNDIKNKVMDVIRDELGYNDVRVQTKEFKLCDLIGIDSIKIIDNTIDWKTAVIESALLLSNSGFVGTDYADNIIDIQEKVGFYSVKDEEFALLHGNNNSVVNVSSMSLLISRHPICFGEKRAKVIFLLASKDKKEQIPAIINLTKMTYDSDFIKKLEEVKSPEEAELLIKIYENKVLRDENN